MERNISINYKYYESWKDLSSQDQMLVERANEARKNAYAPYSKFSVGASVLLENGNVIIGSNQENIAYPSGLCAERVALFSAGANFPNESVETLCIVAEGDLVSKDTILSPCGSCRQVMVETEKRQGKLYRVILVNQNGTAIEFESAKDFLPLAFGI